MQTGIICGALPAYLKSHSQGEYVFDHAWADAYERAGGRYYPKLQIAAPFSPVPGPRLLARDDDIALKLLRAAESVVLQNGLSSAHATFVDEDQFVSVSKGRMADPFGYAIPLGE
jgi:predicted N-acyltransferase